jgi:hypothetical protein
VGYVPTVKQITMLDGDGRPFNTTADDVIILSAGQQISLDAGASDDSDTTLEYSYVLVPANNATNLDRWTARGIEKADSSSNQSASFSESPQQADADSPDSRGMEMQMGSQNLAATNGIAKTQRFQALLKRAAPVPESSVKVIGDGWSDRGKVLYTVDAADECLVPVLAIRNNDAVSLLGDLACWVTQQWRCQCRHTARGKQLLKQHMTVPPLLQNVKNSALQGGTIRVGLLVWAAVLAALYLANR